MNLLSSCTSIRTLHFDSLQLYLTAEWVKEEEGEEQEEEKEEEEEEEK